MSKFLLDTIGKDSMSINVSSKSQVFEIFLANLLNIYSRTRKELELKGTIELFNKCETKGKIATKETMCIDTVNKFMKDNANSILEYVQNGANNNIEQHILDELLPILTFITTMAATTSIVDLSIDYLDRSKYEEIFRDKPVAISTQASKSQRTLIKCTLVAFLAEFARPDATGDIGNISSPAAISNISAAAPTNINIDYLQQITANIFASAANGANITNELNKFRDAIPARYASLCEYLADAPTKHKWAFGGSYLIYVAIVMALIIVVVVILMIVFKKT